MAQTRWKQSKTPAIKPVMAAYLNMARHNMYRVMLHISRQMQIIENKEEAEIAAFSVWQKLSSGTPTEQMKMIKLLQRHFPVLKPVFDVEKKKNVENAAISASPKEIKRIFTTILTALNRLRNEYSHYSPVPRKTEGEEKMIAYLYRCMDGSAREVRNRFSLTVKDPKGAKETAKVLEVNKAVFDIFQDAFRKEKVKALDKSGKVIKDNKGRTQFEFRDKEDYYYALKDANAALSDMGIVFFTCLFLEKRYAAMFLDAIKPWPQDFNEIERKAVLEVFTVYHIHLPKEKYDSTRPEYALGLDMLNELQKCPKELFDILSAKSRDALSVDIKADRPDVVTDDGVTVKDGKVQMRRVRDRFAPLALQYLDSQKAFNDIRFMVRLGHYRFKFYKKQCVADNAPDTLRVLQKEINGFGRLDEMEAARKKNYTPLFKATCVKTNDKGIEVHELVPDAPDSAPYITDTKAHYLIDNNRVGLRIDNPSFLPSLRGEKGAPIQSAGDISLLSPQAWLSTYELPGLVFYQYLYDTYDGHGKHLPSAEEIIKSYILAYKRLFVDLGEGSFDGWDEYAYAPLTLGDLPQKIKGFILHPSATIDPRFQDKANNRIDDMIKRTEAEIAGFDTKMKKLSDKSNKLGKKKYVDIRPGSIASRLVRDILFFTPVSEEKAKITSANFNSLQSALALSELGTNRIKDILRGLNHPFVMKAFEKYRVEDFHLFDFWKVYLNKRLDYLKGLDREKLEEVPFLHSSRTRWQKRDEKYIKLLAGRYEQFELPRSLFTAPTRVLLDEVALHFESGSDRDLSMGNLINLFFSKVLSDNNQPFYRWERHYDVFDKLAGVKSGISLVHQFFKPEQLAKKMRERKTLKPSLYMCEKAVNSVNQNLKKGERRLNIHSSTDLKDSRVIAVAKENLKKAYQDYDDNERILRRFAIQDKVMYLMAKSILLGIKGIEAGSLDRFKLKDILPGKNNTILDILVPFSIVLEIDGIKVLIRQKEKVKIKRYGEFFRYNTDTRLRSLLPLLGKTLGAETEINVELDRDTLEEELSAYDRERVVVMRMVMSLEQSILSRSTGDVPEMDRENFNNLVSKVGHIPYKSHGQILINIRNSFCHNEYARDIVLPEGTPLPQVAETISKLFETERKRRPNQCQE